MTRKILVTGASGTLGGAVAQSLMANGRAILAVSRDPARLSPLFADAARLPRTGDVAAWRMLLENVEHVVHCAGMNRVRSGEGQAALVANVGITADLARAAAGSLRGKFVFISSARAAIAAPSGGTSAKNAPAPADPYAYSKQLAEAEVAKAFGAARNFTILRPVPVYGPRLSGRLATLLRIAQLPLPLPIDGLDARHSLLAIDGFVSAVMHVLAEPATDGGMFVVSDADALTAAEIVAAMRRGLGRRTNVFPLPVRPLLRITRPWSKRRAGAFGSGFVADPSALAATGWTPINDTAAHLEEAVRIGRRSHSPTRREK